MLSKFYIAEVVGIEKVPTQRSNVFTQLIIILPKDSFIGNSKRYAYPPSTMPFTETGGGLVAIPPIGTLCLVAEVAESQYDQIITYRPYDSVGPEGIYTPEESPVNGITFKIGGKVKSVLSLEPEGNFSFVASPNLNFKMNGNAKQIEQTANIVKTYLPTGFTIYDYNETHPITKKENIGEFVSLFGKSTEKRIFSDWVIGTEEVNPLSSTNNYNDKVLIKAGTIYNYAAKANEIGHVYQLETRQSSVNALEKDTVTVLRIGYQEKENLKYGEDTKYSAGTLLEWSAKRVDSTLMTGKYSSFLTRYGKLEDNTTGGEAEETKGEIYRLQIYNDVLDPIGIPVVNPLGKGKGYKYILENVKATEQFTQSFGLLSSDMTFYRMHLHAYDNFSINTLNTPTGIEYTEKWGLNEKNTVYTIKESGTATHVFTTQYKAGVLKIENQHQQELESITIELGNILIKAKEASIKITAEEKLYINSEKVRIGKSVTLYEILSDLMTLINTMTFKTSQGPTLPGVIETRAHEEIVNKITALMGGM